MTDNEALEIIGNTSVSISENGNLADIKKAYEIVKKSIEELQEYKSLGSVEELKEAKEIHKIAYQQDAFFQKDKEIFGKIEKALGFRLYSWQKSYMYTGEFRRIGTTTAQCLKRLLFNKSPIDFSERPRNMKEDCERSEMLRIYDTLQEAGIKTNPILRNRKEKELYMRGLLNEGRLNNLRFEEESAKPGRGFLI